MWASVFICSMAMRWDLRWSKLTHRVWRRAWTCIFCYHLHLHLKKVIILCSTHVLLFISPFPSLRMFSFDELSEFFGLPAEPCEPWELFREGPSRPGDNDSDVGIEFGPDSERLKNFWLGDCGVPSLESLSLDSRLEMFGWMRFPGISFSGVCGSVGHSWSST